MPARKKFDGKATIIPDIPVDKRYDDYPESKYVIIGYKYFPW